ncbi:MAG: type II secretion system protein M [Deltaproteobacteria bacterium]
MARRNKIFKWAAGIVILILGLAVLYDYGILNIHDRLAEVRDLQRSKAKTLQKYTDAIAGKPALEKRLLSLRETRKHEETRLIPGQTPAIAAANLQNAVKDIIVGRGGTINSERVEKAEDLGKFKVTHVVFDVIFPDIRAMSDILFKIETQTPYLVVKELDVRIRNYTDPKDLVVKIKIAALTGG